MGILCSRAFAVQQPEQCQAEQCPALGAMQSSSMGRHRMLGQAPASALLLGLTGGDSSVTKASLPDCCLNTGGLGPTVTGKEKESPTAGRGLDQNSPFCCFTHLPKNRQSLTLGKSKDTTAAFILLTTEQGLGCRSNSSFAFQPSPRQAQSISILFQRSARAHPVQRPFSDTAPVS